MSIADWPDEERPREKLLIRGPAALSDAELLAIFLRTGVAGKTALDLARELLIEFGGLRLLLESDQHRLCQAKGLGPAKYVQLQAGLELARRYFASHLHRGELLGSPRDTANYLNAKLRGYSFEVFACLFLDTHHRVISFEEMFRGTIDMTSVHPREVVRRALEQRAAAVILAHNHPSGVQEPSQADRLLTERLQKALALVDIRVLDHFIIGDGPAISFAEQGWI